MPEHGFQRLAFLIGHALGQAYEIVLAGARDIAQHVREIPATRIRPRQRHFDIHTRHLGGVHIHAREVFIGQFMRHSDGHKAGIAATAETDLIGNARKPLVRQFDQGSNLRQRVLGIVGLFRRDRNTARAAVRGEWPTEPVKDAAPLRRRQLQLDMVGFGLRLVALLVEDLQLEQAGDESGPDHPPYRARNRGAAGEGKIEIGGFLAHPACPASSPGRRPRSNIFCNRA